MLRLAMAMTAVLAVHTGAFLWLTFETDATSAETVATSEVEVRDERSLEAKKLEKLIEQEKKKIEQKLRREFQKELKEMAEMKKTVEAQAEKLRKAEARTQTDRSKLDQKTGRIVELEKKIQRREEEADKRDKDLDKKKDLLDELEKRIQTRENDLGEKEKAIETLTQTLLSQQADIKAAQEKADLQRRQDEKDLSKREKTLTTLAETMKKRQEDIRRDQAKLKEDQRSLVDRQEDNRKEWRKIQDAYKRLEAREADIEKKLKEANRSAGEMEKVKKEWDRIAEEKEKLNETKDVKANVEKFKKSFDREKYLERLSGLMRGTQLRKIESDYTPFNFWSATEADAQNQLRLFGMKDMYINVSNSKFVIVSDYRTGSFSFSGFYPKDFVERFPDFSNVVLERERGREFYQDTLRKALRLLGGDASAVRVVGLMTKVMVYEVYMHQRRVLEVLGLSRKSVVKFTFAAFRHEGQWRFKVYKVVTRSADGSQSTRRIGNYSF